MALFRMKLHACDVAVSDGRGELAAVIASRQGIGNRIADNAEGVHEIKPALIQKVLRKRMPRRQPIYGVPAHVWNSQSRSRRKASGMSLDQPEARKIALLASQGQHLHADANSQQRTSGSRKFEHRVTQPGTLERTHTGVEGADTGQDQ